MGNKKGMHRDVSWCRVCYRVFTKAKGEIAIDDNQLEQVVAGIQKAANTGKIGDGKILCLILNMSCASEPAKPVLRLCERRGR